MQIKIKEISKETLEKNGWKYSKSLRLYYKEFNECMVRVRLADSVLPLECWISNYDVVTPNDLIAIAEELKKTGGE
jgi:hypothetical protein